MKKFLALLLALVMVFALVACGSSNTPSTPNTPDAPQQFRWHHSQARLYGSGQPHV